MRSHELSNQNYVPVVWQIEPSPEAPALDDSAAQLLDDALPYLNDRERTTILHDPVLYAWNVIPMLMAHKEAEGAVRVNQSPNIDKTDYTESLELSGTEVGGAALAICTTYSEDDAIIPTRICLSYRQPEYEADDQYLITLSPGSSEPEVVAEYYVSYEERRRQVVDEQERATIVLRAMDELGKEVLAAES
jgi:hypothetical protein